MQLNKKRVIIVGGSSGIGLATAKLAHAQGASVSIMARNDRALQLASAALPGSTWASVDVGDEQAVEKAFAQFDYIDHVYIAAGSTKLGGILDSPVESQMGSFVERLWGNVYVTRAAVPKIRAGGSISFTGGLSTDRPVAGAWVSGIGTATSEQLARVLALELAPIRFNAISPGYTETPMWDKVLGDNRVSVLENVATTLPLKRIATAKEVAEAVIFLMSNPSITGEILHVDGGARLV